jgi:hypothetical protein
MIGGSLFNDFFGNSNSLLGQVFGQRGKSIRAISAPLKLTVRERPEQALGQRWLPARDLDLVEIWGEGVSDVPDFKVGEPIDRIIAIRARGVASSQLPIPKLTDVHGVKQYTEPTYEDSQLINGQMIAVRALPTVLIPTREGHLTLPAIDVEWWDSETDQARVATLPSRTVQVHPDKKSPTQAEILPATAERPPQSPEIQEQVSPTQSDTTGIAFSTFGWISFWIALGSGIIALIGLRKSRSHAKLKSPIFFNKKLKHIQLKRQLKHACKSGGSTTAETALLKIAHLKWPESPPHSTTEIHQRLRTSEMTRAIRTLAASRYGKNNPDKWAGDSPGKPFVNQAW